MQDNRLHDVPPRHDRSGDEAGRLAALRRYDILDTAEEEPFQRIVELVCQILDVPIAAVTLIDADRQWIKAASGASRGSAPLDISFCRHTIAQSEPLSVPDAQYDPRFAANPTVTGAPRIASYLGVPLTTPDGYNVGALCAVDRDPRQFDARQASILKKLADIVVEQMELRQIAKHDALTGALTRRGFLAEVEREFQRAARYERPSSMIAIDVDHFRAINDRHGHAAGDAVLVSIASACMASMRKSDVFGRVGGEEFAMLLPETTIEDARDVAERLREAIEATIVETPAASLRATVSCGVAQMPAVSEGADVWLAEADIALYEAKQFGRNRVVAGRPRRPLPPPTDAVHQLHNPH